MAPIVVGVDGSDGSQRALQWALEEGRRLGAPVHVVHTWWMPPEYAAYPAIAEARDPAPVGEEMRRAGESLVQRMLEAAGGETKDVEVHTEVVNEPPAQALIARSAEADRVAVGARGLGGFRAMLLGSVTQQLVQHARCPVVVIPAES